jgi:hypothetical protein
LYTPIYVVLFDNRVNKYIVREFKKPEILSRNGNPDKNLTIIQKRNENAG